MTLYVHVFPPPDARVRDYPLMRSPVQMTSILLAYVFLSVYIGPRLMANRKPFRLNTAMIAYNLSMVLLNGYIVYEVNKGNALLCVCAHVLWFCWTRVGSTFGLWWTWWLLAVQRCVAIHSRQLQHLTDINVFFRNQFMMSGWATTYTWRCDLIDTSSSPQTLRVSLFIFP